jgi:hypothetical protein
MRTSIIIACLIIYGFHNSVEAQSPLPLSRKPTKSEITLYSGPDNMIGALFLLKDSSILVSNSLVKEHFNSGNYEVAELYIDDINLIRSKRRVGPLNGGILGALVGAGVFALGTRIAIGPPPYPIGFIGFSADDNYIFMLPAGAILGATTGAIIGGIRIKIPINGSIDNYNRKKKKLGRYTVKYDGSPTY